MGGAKGNIPEMCLKSSDQYFNQRGPWFERVEIIASAPTSEVPRGRNIDEI